MVAIGDDGRPAPVPALEPVTQGERRREKEAQLRRDNRLAERELIRHARSERP
jgi:acyl-CoA hydrolase